MKSVKSSLLASTAVAGLVAMAVPGAAEAQSNPATSASASEVVVTGSRIARRDYVSDSPIVSVSPAAIENTGDVTLEHLLNNMPQIVPGLGSQINNGGNGQINVQLRGLGSNRTLVLVDGRRITPSNASGTVDINTIPQAMIESIEVISGGASAVYGSDAVGGVVNFKLKHRFSGIQIDATYNISAQDDGEQNGVAVTVGGNFADDRGNAVLSFGYDNRQPVFYGQRPDVKVDGVSVLAVSGPSGSLPQGVATPFLVAGNRPTQAAVDAVFGGYGVAAGTIGTNFPYGINSDGTLFNGSANYRGPTSIDFSTIPLSAPGSGNAGNYNTGALNYILTPQTRYNVFGRAEYAVTSHLKAYTQFNYANYTASTVLAPSPAAGNPAVGGTGFQVSALNPFIPADLRTILNSRPDPNAPFLLNKRFTALGPRLTSTEYANYQILTGVQGDVPGYDLNYDFYTSFGHFSRVDLAYGNISHANVAAALASSTGTAGGCALNLFGNNSISSNCAAFLSQPTKNYTTYDQRIAEGTLQGHMFNLPAGEARFALGADYRSDKYALVPDALLSSTDKTTNSYTAGGTTYNLTNNTAGVVGGNAVNPLTGYIDVYEVYGEALIPILKDLPFIQSLKADLGVRETFYNRAGNAFTWKANGDWRVTDWLLIRGGYNRAIRAPNIGELFAPQTNGFFEIGPAKATTLTGDPCDIRSGYRNAATNPNAAQVRALCISQGVSAALIDNYQFGNTQVQSTGGGNPNLKPETANTYTGGIVLTPHFSYPMLKRLTMSIDYYSIQVTNFIGAVGPATSIPKCFNFDGTSNPSYSNSYSLCGLFQRDPATGQIVAGQAFNNNLGGIKTSGVDFELDWNFRLSEVPALGLPDRFGSLGISVVGSWLNRFQVETLPGDPFVEGRGYIASGPGGAFPVWKGVINASYTLGPWQLGLTERYIGNAKDASCDGVPAACKARGVDPTFYTDLNARWKMTDNLELRAGVTNAMDQIPRFFTSGSASQGGTDATTYDLIGRRYFVALKARF